MKNLLKNKIFIILGLLFILCSLNSKVFASSEKSFDFNDSTYYYNLPEGCINYIIAYDSNSSFLLFYTKDNDGVFNYGTRGGYPSVQYYTDKSFSSIKKYYRTYNKIYATTQSDGKKFIDFANSNSLREYDTFSNCLGLVYSTVNIYDMNDSNKVVFQAPPVPILAKVVELGEAKEITTTLAGLLKLLIPLLICLLGLWKGLNLLLRILRMA